MSINLGAAIGLLITNIIQGESKQTVEAEKLGFICPSVFAFLNILMWLFLVKHDSFYHLLEKGKEEEAFIFF